MNKPDYEPPKAALRDPDARARFSYPAGFKHSLVLFGAWLVCMPPWWMYFTARSLDAPVATVSIGYRADFILAVFVLVLFPAIWRGHLWGVLGLPIAAGVYVAAILHYGTLVGLAGFHIVGLVALMGAGLLYRRRAPSVRDDA